MAKKKVFILGAAGMLGHKLCQEFKDKYETYYSVRKSFKDYQHYGIFEKQRMIEGLDVLNEDQVIKAIGQVQPDVLINCVGIIKQLKEAEDPVLSLKINSLLPHQLADISKAAGARFFHISTDCVFNGRKGNYTEEDPCDAEDLYGRTKYLGEVNRDGALTLRTSIIGRELNTRRGLIEWFLSNKGGKVKGFTKAIYTGFTTIRLSGIISNLIDNFPDLSGVYQVSSDPIDKCTLLNLVKEKFGLDIEIEPDSKVSIDRSLNSEKFRSQTGFKPCTWEEMIEEMAKDPTPYDVWHEDNEL